MRGNLKFFVNSICTLLGLVVSVFSVVNGCHVKHFTSVISLEIYILKVGAGKEITRKKKTKFLKAMGKARMRG